MKTSTTRLLGLLAGASTLIAGCGPPVRIDGTDMVADYRLGELTTDLPEPVDVLTASAAVERVMDARGMTLVGRESSAERTTLRGRWAGARFEEEYVVIASRAIRPERGTRLQIYVTPVGDRGRSEEFLSDVLHVLGLRE